MRTGALLLLSAALHTLAFPPWSMFPISFVAVAPFLVAIRALPAGRAALAGHLWGSLAIWGVGYWVAEALTFYYEQPWWFGVLFCLIGCQILWGFYYALFAAAASYSLPRLAPLWRPLLTAALWVACELGRAQLMTGEPWMLLGYAAVPSPWFIQAADIGGVYLLSFCIIFINAALAEIVLTLESPQRRTHPLAPSLGKRGGTGESNDSPPAPFSFQEKGVWGMSSVAARMLAAPILLLVVCLIYGGARLGQTFEHDEPLRVTVVQGNNDLGIQWKPEHYGAGLDLYTRLSREALQSQPADLLVWPESAITFFLAHEPLYQKALARGLEGLGADLIAGAPHHEHGEKYFNSAFHVAADGEITGRYDKTHLLPFGEYFPLRFIELLRRRFERVRTFTPGAEGVLLDTRAGPAAVVICFEAIFPEIVRKRMAAGAKFLVNLSNDVWLGSGVGQAQHLAMVVLRAVENRTWVVRSTTTGISAFIDPWGRIRAAGPLFEEAVLRQEITPQQVATVYQRWGDVFAYTCVAVSLLVAVSAALTTRR